MKFNILVFSLFLILIFTCNTNSNLEIDLQKSNDRINSLIELNLLEMHERSFKSQPFIQKKNRDLSFIFKNALFDFTENKNFENSKDEIVQKALELNCVKHTVQPKDNYEVFELLNCIYQNVGINGTCFTVPQFVNHSKEFFLKRDSIYKFNVELFFFDCDLNLDCYSEKAYSFNDKEIKCTSEQTFEVNTYGMSDTTFYFPIKVKSMDGFGELKTHKKEYKFIVF